ncbi:MAG: hypothetical protein RQ824_11525 [bacterium]|nr:hypothetical protein [bacterium]
MFDVIKKTLEVGLGAVTMTQEKLKEITDELVVKGNLTEKEGGDILKDLLKTADDSRKKLKETVEDQVHKVISELGLATVSDIKALDGRITALEKKQDKKRPKKEPAKKK